MTAPRRTLEELDEFSVELARMADHLQTGLRLRQEALEAADRDVLARDLAATEAATVIRRAAGFSLTTVTAKAAGGPLLSVFADVEDMPSIMSADARQAYRTAVTQELLRVRTRMESQAQEPK